MGVVMKLVLFIFLCSCSTTDFRQNKLSKGDANFARLLQEDARRYAPLSEDFTLKELTRSDKASQKHILNIPGEEEIKNLQWLVEQILQPIQDQFGKILISSAYRCPKLNKAVGGTIDSHHLALGNFAAADFRVVDTSLDEVYYWIQTSSLPFEQLILEDDLGVIHITTKRPDRTAMRRYLGISGLLYLTDKVDD